MQKLELDVNGERVTVDADPQTPLLYVLRNDLGLRAAKLGCGLEQCRACAVLADGDAVPTCVTPASAFAGRRIVTLEGLADRGLLHPVQQAFLDEQAAQCGYCTAGLIVGAVALLARNPAPTDQEVRTALDPHLCRCGSHPRVLRAVRRAAESGA
jgi:nicotinate dehydrogenase subunit A